MMRILIAGDNPTAKALRGYLARHDFHLTSYAPDYTVRIDEDPLTAGIQVGNDLSVGWHGAQTNESQ